MECGPRFSGCRGLERQSDAVHAVAQPRRLLAVVEDVTQMTAAAAAMHGIAHHAEAPVLLLAHRAVDRRPEARPAGVAVELRLGREGVLVASRAGEGAPAMLVEERARER